MIQVKSPRLVLANQEVDLLPGTGLRVACLRSPCLAGRTQAVSIKERNRLLVFFSPIDSNPEAEPSPTPEQVAELFQPFSRLYRDRHREGTGIGLAVCRRLIESMGGRIGVSTQLDEGSRFWIELPTSGVFSRDRRRRASGAGHP